MTFTLPALSLLAFFAIALVLVGLTRWGRPPARSAMLWSGAFAIGAMASAMALGGVRLIN